MPYENERQRPYAHLIGAEQLVSSMTFHIKTNMSYAQN